MDLNVNMCLNYTSMEIETNNNNITPVLLKTGYFKLNSFYGPAIMGPILFIILIIIIVGYLLCNYALLTTRFNKLIINLFYLWIIMVIWVLYETNNYDKKTLALRKRVEEEIPHN